MTGDQLEPSSLLLLGEIKGQLRELIHSSNNTAMAVNALGNRVAALEATNQAGRVDMIEARVVLLEKADQRRAGAYSFATDLKSWAPAIVVLIAAIILFLKMNGTI